MTVAELKLWGNTIGAASVKENDKFVSFQYAPEFLKSGIELSPLKMPLSNRVYRFADLAYESFHGLPGMLADSLPDKFGNALIDTWLEKQGRNTDSFNSVERLCYIGDRGMGALEYHPATGPKRSDSSQVEVAELVELASEILSKRELLYVSFNEEKKQQALTDILHVGTSAGGARAKAIIAWNPISNEVRSGQVMTNQDFEYWMLKFDGVTNNRDKELADPKGYGLIEYAYSNMAKDAGITMSKCRTFEENGRHHFMTKRFDRLAGGEKLHMQSLAGLAHYDYNLARAYSYEQALLVIRKLDLSMDELEELFRRMVFNVVARNQDDHVKNIGFLMDKSGKWFLSPAFDVTYSYNPKGDWTSQHQMSINGKTENILLNDLKACAKTASMKRGRAEKILGQVKDAVADWRSYADDAGIDSKQAKKIQKSFRMDI